MVSLTCKWDRLVNEFVEDILAGVDLYPEPTGPGTYEVQLEPWGCDCSTYAVWCEIPIGDNTLSVSFTLIVGDGSTGMPVPPPSYSDVHVSKSAREIPVTSHFIWNDRENRWKWEKLPPKM
jgi:hypothetical protein